MNCAGISVGLPRNHQIAKPFGESGVCIECKLMPQEYMYNILNDAGRSVIGQIDATYDRTKNTQSNCAL